MKYSVVLIPKSKKVTEEFFNLSKEISSAIEGPPKYLLKKHSSLPHISILQFEISESKEKNNLLDSVNTIIDAVWKNILLTHRTQTLTCQLIPKINYKHTNKGVFSGIV